METARIGKQVNVFTVIFEFDTTPAAQQQLAGEIQKLVTQIVSNQDGFLSAHLHLSTDGEKVLNYFQWKDQKAFETFRANEEVQQKIKPVIAPYGPKPRIYEIVYSA